MVRRSLAVVFAAVLVLGQAATVAATGVGSGAGGRAALAAPKVDRHLAKSLEKGSVRFVVEFGAKADLRSAAKQKSHSSRGRAVYTALTKTASSAQAAALGVARKAKGANPRSYWLTNELLVTGDAKLANALAALPGVAAVRPMKQYPLVRPVDVRAAVLAAAGDPEWGVEKIGADQAWADGVTGQGVTVATIDTGVDYTHPALVENYRGNNHDGTFSFDYNWWDPANICGGEPCDNVGHGTHTMGTIAGGDGPGPFTPDTGVAPGATWFAAKGCEDLFCSEESLLSSGQFILAPTDLNGDNPNPDLRPDVVSNSWGNDDPNDTFFLETTQAWRAAGIIPVFAAGNAGPGCGSAGSPGDELEVISAGATDDNDLIAEFSSRGPSPTDKISPNVSAPGVDVVSSVPGGGYEAFSGTSMATPHVAGAIALMLSAKPALAGNFDAVLDALDKTAVDRPDDQCGTPDPSDNDPNFVYGEGRIDAKAAIDLVKTGGTLAGTVTDAGTSAPIAGARITADDGSRQYSTTTDGSGAYSLFLAAGSYGVSATAFGYAVAAAGSVTIATDQTTTEDFALTALPRFHVTGQVTASEDGSPIEGASVSAIGTPVPAATTDAGGAYSLELPIGSYTLRANAGGCTETKEIDVSSTGDDVIADFALFRKLDDFGHGCRAIPFDWVEASTQSALFGDEFAGRLTLPFGFDFYGQTYQQVFISDNGYLNFLAPDQFNSLPIGLPSPTPPNAAIYAFWQDLHLDEKSAIDYETIGSSPDRAFVIEYAGVLAGATRLSFEVKLWEDGRIDLLYGDNPASPGDGRNAGIGIENADGTDALQLSFLEPVLGPNRAFRIEPVPTGLVHGTVTDANDGTPIAGATVTADPGGRSASTDADGAYTLRLRPGAYTIGASKPPYVDGSQPATVVDGGDVTADFVLDASIALVDPASVEESVDFGGQTSTSVTLSNPGSAPLLWTARERNQGADTPPLPTPSVAVRWSRHWGPTRIPASFPRTKVADTGLTLDTIIEDPADDSLDSNEIVAVRAASDGSSVASLALDFTDATPMNEIGGYVYFDTDQDPSTGLPAEAQFGLPTQDVGMEYFADLFEVFSDGVVPIWSADTGDLLALVPATIDGHSILFDVPLDALGGDDGFINTDLVVGFQGPSDWAADVGHGTIEPFTDAPWLTETPDAGEVATGADATVALGFDASGLRPGDYHAQVVFVTNAPRQRLVPVDVTLRVTMPDAFGEIAGTVGDAHSGEPVAGASVVVHTTWQGSPLDIPATAGDDGTYDLVGPEGTWSATYAADGYVAVTRDVTITRGVTTAGVDVALHLDQPHATLDAAPITFVLTPGRTGQATVTLGNVDGHEPLTFSTDEVRIGDGGGAIASRPASITSRTAPKGHVASRVAPRDLSAAQVLVVEDVLPFDSDALFRVLDDDGIAFDLINSDALADTNLAAYSLVIVANDQPQAFYDAFTANAAAFEAFVDGGGFLWMSAAPLGFNGGDLDGAVLPGGATVHDPVFEDQNDIADPSHPIVAGLPDPFSGSFASHASFGDLPTGTDVIATGHSSHDPTIIEYGFGAGHVLATGQPYDFGLDFGEDTGQILVNGVPYAFERAITSDAPWLSESPAAGTVAVGASQPITISVDSTGLAPGVYRAGVRIQTDDPDNPAFLVPVTLVVPAYQQGVNAGGGSYTNANGDVYAADRAYGAGGYGYVGTSAARTTSSPIANTTDDPLYQSLRSGMSSYRFDVADGHYRVDLRLAEIEAKKAGGRIFSVSVEGSTVIADLDLVAAAGRNTAYDRSFEVDVTDGHLDIGFVAQRGDKPVINAILVTEMPPGSPGL